MVKSHCTCTCIKSSNIACCVWKTLQDCISVYELWRFEIWENHFNSHTIITTWWGLSPSRYILYLPHVLENTLAIIFKAFLILLFLVFFAYFYLNKTCMGIQEIEKKYLFMLSFWHCTFAMPKHTGVILWLAGNSDEMVIYTFLLGFLVIPVKKSDMSVKYKR